MKVKELIEELSKYPDDMEVWCGTDHCEADESVAAVYEWGDEDWRKKQNKYPRLYIG